MPKYLATVLVIGFASAGIIVAHIAAALVHPDSSYAVIDSIPGGLADGIWDYATVDSYTERLYLAQGGVTVLDLRSRAVKPQFAQGRCRTFRSFDRPRRNARGV